MASPTLLTIPVSASQLKRLERLAQESGLTVEELAAQALLVYEREKRTAPGLWDTVRAIQKDAKQKGLDKMTKREINTEVKAARAELKLNKASPIAS